MSVVVVCGPKGADFDPVVRAVSNAIEDVIIVSVDRFEDSWVRMARAMGDQLEDALSQWPMDVSNTLLEMIHDGEPDGDDGEPDGDDGEPDGDDGEPDGDDGEPDGDDGASLPDNARLRPLKIAFLKLATDYALELAEEGHDCVLLGGMDEEERDFVIREFEIKFESASASEGAEAAAKEAYIAWRTCVSNMQVMFEVLSTGRDAGSAAIDCVEAMEEAVAASAMAVEAVESDRKGVEPAWSEHTVPQASVDDYGELVDGEPNDLLVELCQAALGAAKAAQAAAIRTFDDDGSFSVEASDAAKVALASAMCLRDAMDMDDEGIERLIDHVNDIVDNGPDVLEGGGAGASLVFVEVLGAAEGYVGIHETDRLDEPTFVALGNHEFAVVDLSQDPVLVESTLSDEALTAALTSADGEHDVLDESDFVTPDDDEVWDRVMGHMTPR